MERAGVPGLLEVLREEGIDGVRYALWNVSGWHRDYSPPDPTLGDYRNHLLLEIDRDRLLTAPFKWTAKVKQDIEGFPPRFELDPHIVNTFMCLERINNAVVVAVLPVLKQYAEIVINRVEDLGDEQGIPALVHFNPPVRG